MIFNASEYTNQNVSGVLLEIPAAMKIAGIKKIFPNVQTIGLLYSPNSAATYADVSAECEKQGLTLKAKPVNSEAEFADTLNSVLPGSDCFLVIMDTKVYFSQTVRLLLLQSIKMKVPVVGLSSFFTKAGAAISFDSDYKDLGRQAGEIAEKILSGKKASEIKPVYPRKYRYTLNLTTAEKIGITFPQSVIKDASEVFN
jgi:putative ABC transport system substrate-binding protein